LNFKLYVEMEEWLLSSLRFTSTRVVDRTSLGKLWEEIKKSFHTQTWTKVRSSDQNWENKRKGELCVNIYWVSKF